MIGRRGVGIAGMAMLLPGAFLTRALRAEPALPP
jgi:hypothetical protein